MTIAKIIKANSISRHKGTGSRIMAREKSGETIKMAEEIRVVATANPGSPEEPAGKNGSKASACGTGSPLKKPGNRLTN